MVYCLKYIEKYKIELKPSYDYKEDGSLEFIGWKCFNCKNGGHWYYGDTVKECIQDLVMGAESNG